MYQFMQTFSCSQVSILSAPSVASVKISRKLSYQNAQWYQRHILIYYGSYHCNGVVLWTRILTRIHNNLYYSDDHIQNLHPLKPIRLLQSLWQRALCAPQAQNRHHQHRRQKAELGSGCSYYLQINDDLLVALWVETALTMNIVLIAESRARWSLQDLDDYPESESSFPAAFYAVYTG